MTAGAIEFLDAHDARAGDFVPSLLTSRPNSVALMLAGAMSARPLAPLSPRLTPRELRAVIECVPGRHLLTEPQFVDVATDLAAAVGKRVVVVADLESGTAPLCAGTDPDAIAFVMHTSGTTGSPKQVLVKEAPLRRRAEVNGYLCNLGPGARQATPALFHHVAGIGNMAVALASGAAVVMFPEFSVGAWQRLEAVEPTHCVLVVSMIEILLSADALALPSMRTIGYGGSPIHPETMRRVQEVIPGVDFVNLFGQTEGSPVTVLTAEDHRVAIAGRTELLRSVGRAAPGVELHIHNPDADGIGEVWARCAHSFVVDENGWQHTGDVGHLVDGYLYLVGRRGDKIIRGGENVFPLEVEQVIETHPAIAQAGVVGKPDVRHGETVVAFLVAADPNSPPDTENVRTYCRERLAGFKVPVEWTFVDALPRNPNGKLVRRELAARAAAG